MSLTLTEQQKLVDGEIHPPNKNLAAFATLVQLSGLNHARDFANQAKDFETVDNSDPANPISINQKAVAYLNKMMAVTSRMLSSDSKQNTALRNTMASLISKKAEITEQQLKDGNRAYWEDLVETNIRKAMELFAGITKNERIEYNNL